ITELATKTEALRNILDIDVDLKIVTDNYTIALKKAILEGEVISYFCLLQELRRMMVYPLLQPQ
ncbi:hypothetical protein ACTPEM_23170, partial [Clostridioides difficile]